MKKGSRRILFVLVLVRPELHWLNETALHSPTPGVGYFGRSQKKGDRHKPGMVTNECETLMYSSATGTEWTVAKVEKRQFLGVLYKCLLQIALCFSNMNILEAYALPPHFKVMTPLEWTELTCFHNEVMIAGSRWFTGSRLFIALCNYYLFNNEMWVKFYISLDWTDAGYYNFYTCSQLALCKSLWIRASAKWL